MLRFQTKLKVKYKFSSNFRALLLPMEAPLTTRLSEPRSLLATPIALPALLSFGLFAFHFIFNLTDGYGIFRDEFYYLACSEKLSWGYVDHPPLSVFLLALQTALFGNSMVALRLLPALAMAGTVFISGLVVYELKGGKPAQVLACVAVATAPIYLAMGSYYSMNSLDIFLWSAIGLLLIKLCEYSHPSRWLWLGLLLGLGLLNKVGVLWLGFGIFIGIIFTPLRRELSTPWPYAAAAIALVCFLPFLLWNMQYSMPHLEFMQNAVGQKYSGISRWDFLAGALLQLNPLSVLIWLPGLFFFLFSATGKKYRLIGWVFLSVFIILLLNGHSKSEYLAPACVMLFAGGAVLLESLSQRLQHPGLLLFFTFLLFCSGLALAPLARPVLAVDAFIRYSQWLGISQPNSEGKELKALPQFYADRFGWEGLAADVSEVYQRLGDKEKAQAKVYTQNYGEAGALQYYASRYPLPPVISGHNQYWLWGWGEGEISTLIVVGGEQQDHLESFEEVVEAGMHHAQHAMPYEDELPIFICRKPKFTAAEIWPSVKHYE